MIEVRVTVSVEMSIVMVRSTTVKALKASMATIDAMRRTYDEAMTAWTSEVKCLKVGP